MVEEGLSSNVYQVEKLEFSLDVKNFLTTISKVKPDLVFNLVESVDNRITSYNVCYTKLLRDKFSDIASDMLQSFLNCSVP